MYRHVSASRVLFFSLSILPYMCFRVSFYYGKCLGCPGTLVLSLCRVTNAFHTCGFFKLLCPEHLWFPSLPRPLCHLWFYQPPTSDGIFPLPNQRVGPRLPRDGYCYIGPGCPVSNLLLEFGHSTRVDLFFPRKGLRVPSVTLDASRQSS